MFSYKIDPADLGRIDAKGQVVLALEIEKMRELNKIKGSDFLSNINFRT